MYRDLQNRTKKIIPLYGKYKTIRIYSHDIGMEFRIENCTMPIMTSEKNSKSGRNRTTTLKMHQNTWRRRKTTCTWYYRKRIPSNKQRWKKKKEKSTSEEQENFQKSSFATEISSKVLIPGDSPCKIFRTILKRDTGETQTKGAKDKKNDDDVQGITYERWHRQTVCVKKRKNALRRYINTRTQGLCKKEQRMINYRSQLHQWQHKYK